MKRPFILATLFFILFVSGLNAQTLHLVLFSATKDFSIGEGCKINYERVNREVKKMAQLAGMRYAPYCKTGVLATPKEMKTQLQSLNVGNKDVIIFHYSGHAVNDGRSKWPRLLLNGGTLKLTYVRDMLKSKKARLTFTIGDCCNSTYFAQRGKLAKNTLQAGSKTSQASRACKKLLLGERGHWIISGSQKSKSSYYNELVGGFLTFSLFESLYQVTHTQASPLSWEQVFEGMVAYTQNLAREMRKTQTPQFSKSAGVIIGTGSYASTPSKLPDFTLLPNAELATTYKVKPGDSFSSIATKFAGRGYNITYKDVAEQNNLPINGTIVPGQIINVINRQTKTFRYRVEKNDNLGKIASDQKVSEDALRLWNTEIIGDDLQIGQVLIIHKQ